jgi:mRNA interferase MazF
MVEKICRFDIVLVKLNPTVGSEIQKTRPCIVISPDEMQSLKTVIIAPMKSKGLHFIFRPHITFEGTEGLVLLDQIRAVDKTRIIKTIGKVEKKTAQSIASMLQEMFRY